ncbi:hypothetical protein KAW80_01575 [Candidatus Babeliales bacterium]|nr:hypothetical protein [Candidatus Babeliales bacterium]
MNKKANHPNNCPRCGNPTCDGYCEKSRSVPEKHKKKQRKIDKDKTPNRVWPTDQEKNKGPKI